MRNYFLFLFLFLFSFTSTKPTISESSSEVFVGCSDLLQTKVKKYDGSIADLCNYQGQVLLIVNTASKCGFTGQFSELETLYKEYKEQGFMVLAFPSGDFMWQEFSSDKQIQEFCSKKFAVTFPVFAKAHVKGSNQLDLFNKLSSKMGSPKWNFQKYLINREGEVVKTFAPWVKPSDQSIVSDIEKELAKQIN